MAFSLEVALDQSAAVAAAGGVAVAAVGIRSPFFVPGDLNVLGLEVAGKVEAVETYSVRTMDALVAVVPALAYRDALVEKGLGG